MVFVALILSHIIYALPAWGGHLARQLQERLDVCKRARNFGFCDANYTTRQMLGFLGTVFIIFYQILSTVVSWSLNGWFNIAETKKS